MRRLLILFFLFSSFAAAQGVRTDGVAQSRNGAPAPGVTIAVCTQPSVTTTQPCSPLATLYTDPTNSTACSGTLLPPPSAPGGPCSNPMLADGLGNYHFYLPAGTIYTIQFYGGGITATAIPDQKAGGGSGSSPCVATANSVQKNLSGSLACTSATDDAAGFHFKGPNPYVDATSYGVRALVSNATPAISGITATTNGTTTVTVSTSSCLSQTGSVCFVNGDGVTIYNVGPAITMTTPSAPTVTPSNAQFGTGTGIVVNAPSGSTTFNYKVLACDINGGCTAASTTGSTTTGNTLGAQSLSVTSITRSNDTLTFNTPSQPNFSVGTQVHVDGCANADNAAGFCGWFNVSTVTAGGFTVATTGLDTRNGALTTSSAGGTVNWMNCNHVAWTSVAGVFRYVVQSDRQNPGTFVNIGMSWPVDGSTLIDGTLYFDDFGQTMMARSASSIPGYVPTNGSATNDNLTTTITSGAGTTTLVLVNAATQSLSGQTILFDNAPNIVTANSSVTGALEFPFPAAGTYVTNSILNITTHQSNQWMLPAGALFNDTVVWNSNSTAGIAWYGDRIPGTGSASAFQPKSIPAISFGSTPGLLLANGTPGAGEIRSLSFQSSPNGIAVMADGGGGNLGMTYDLVNLLGNGTSTDYMTMGFVCRGASGASCVARMGTVLVAAGSQSMTDSSFTPSAYWDDVGDITINNLMGFARAMYLKADQAGSQIRVGSYHWQGNTGAVISASPANGGINIIMGDAGTSIIDTGANAAVFVGPTAGHGINIACGPGGCGAPASAFTTITGARAGLVIGTSSGQNRSSVIDTIGAASDGVFGSFTGVDNGYPQRQINESFSLAPGYGIFVNLFPPTPTTTVNSGGSLSIGAHTANIVPVWQNGADGQPSTAVPFTTSTGSQSVTLNWTAVPGNPKGIDVFIDGAPRNTNSTACTSPQLAATATSVTISVINFSCSSGTTIAAGGPTMLMGGTQGIAAPTVVTSTVNVASNINISPFGSLNVGLNAGNGAEANFFGQPSGNFFTGLANGGTQSYNVNSQCLGWSNNNDTAQCGVRSVTPTVLDAMFGTYRVSSDQTITAGASLTAIPGLSWTLPANTAVNVNFSCHILYSQATAAASDSFGVQDVTVAPTSVEADAVIYTNATSGGISPNIPALTTTTATAFTSFTPSAAATVFNAYVSGTIEQPSNASSSVFQIMAQFTTNNGTIKRGSACQVF